MRSISSADTGMIYQCITAGTFGIIVNAFVLIVMSRNRQLCRKDYIRFIMNRMLIDCFYSLSLITLQPLGMWSTSGDVQTLECDMASFSEVSLSIMAIVAEPVLACNRYMAVCHSNWHKRIYTTYTVIGLCIFIWLISTASAIPHLFYHSFGRVPGIFCSIRFGMDTLLVTAISNHIIVLSSIGLVAIFNVKMYHFLQRYQKQATTGRQRSKLQKDGEMLRFVLVAASLPLVMQTPIAVGTFVRMASPEIVTDWVLFCVTSIFVLCPLVNPLVTVFMVKPLKKEFKFMFDHFFKSQTSVSAIAPSNTTVATISVRSMNATQPTE